MARANGKNPGAAGLVCPGFGQRLIDLLEQLGRTCLLRERARRGRRNARRPRAPRASALAGSQSPGRRRPRAGPGARREPAPRVPLRDRRASTPRQARTARPPPRGAATCCLLGGQLELLGNGCVGPVGGEREVAGPLLGVRHGVGQRTVNGAALPTARARSRSTRASGCAKRRDDSSISTTPSAPRPPAPRARGRGLRRRGQQLDGRPGKRSDKEQDVERLSREGGRGGRQAAREGSPGPSAWPAPARVRPHELRPSSSAKNGFPADASCTRTSSGRVSSSPNRSSSSRWSAARRSGPSLS